MDIVVEAIGKLVDEVDKDVVMGIVDELEVTDVMGYLPSG